MVSAPIVLTAVAIIFILQMITMIQVRKLKKTVGGVKNEDPGFSNQKIPQKDPEIIREKKKVDRPQVSDSPVKPQTPITSVERSLRDINLRLKNAERDQERARRKIGKPEDSPDEKRPREERPRDDRPRSDRPRENRPRDDRPRDDRPRDDRPRDDRPRDDRPRSDRPRSDRPRDDRPRENRPRENRPRDDRPRDDRPYGNEPNDKRPMNDGPKQVFKRRDYNEKVTQKPPEPVPTVPEESRPMDIVPPPVFTPPVLKEEIPVEVKQPEIVAPVIESADSTEQSFGRGSKITVKRRTLNGEGAEPEKVSDEPDVSAPAVNTETPSEQNISFGRR